MRGKDRWKRFLQELIDKRHFDDKNKVETIFFVNTDRFFVAQFLKMFDAN